MNSLFLSKHFKQHSLFMWSPKNYLSGIWKKRTHLSIRFFSSSFTIIIYKFLSPCCNFAVSKGPVNKQSLNAYGQIFTWLLQSALLTLKKCNEWLLLCSEACSDFDTTELTWLHLVAVWIPCSKSFNVKNTSTKSSFIVRGRSLKSQKHYQQKNAKRTSHNPGPYLCKMNST